jgi:hypothetical protein
MVMGMVVWGPSRGGKWEMSGVLGGGSVNENSAANVESWVAVGERAIKKLTGGLAESSDTIACGDKSWGSAREKQSVRILLGANDSATFCGGCEEDDMREGRYIIHGDCGHPVVGCAEGEIKASIFNKFQKKRLTLSS